MADYNSRAELYKGLFDASVDRALDGANANELGLRDQVRTGQSDLNYPGQFLSARGGLFTMGGTLAE